MDNPPRSAVADWPRTRPLKWRDHGQTPILLVAAVVTPITMSMTRLRETPSWRATLCDMRTVTHREMRNQSGEILRQVADGETIQVTNNGQIAALIVPPGTDPLADLVSRGQVRVARNPASGLRSITRRKSTTASQAIVADVRGRW